MLGLISQRPKLRAGLCSPHLVSRMHSHRWGEKSVKFRMTVSLFFFFEGHTYGIWKFSG